MNKPSSIDVFDIVITGIFAPIALWMVLQYFKPVSVDEQIKMALSEEHIKAVDLYYNELAVNHPYVIMDAKSPLIKLKRKDTNKLVFCK